ncbi:mucoidy inhibitor MuiA family protein [Aquimarina sp. D1M17]|uniref:DUF4139 domain-containing protein n=1 Tax=Aquimarina acroporae TaxID=2937283 RepID=UPI0020BDB2FE|nr:DUF4139 domain-containing protein [Aquimarina acroporae]MCK8520285.1 mucoidy inhibitor MuiA family protein [Aquimarina acroporae]
MKTYTLAFLILISFLGYADSEKKIDSTIDEVTIYLSGAQIKRSARVNLKPGTNEIVLSHLSPNIEKNSIQISGLKKTSILSINFNIDYLDKKKQSKDLEILHHRLDSLLFQKNKLENILSGLGQEKKLLDNNQRISSNTESLSLERIKQISTYYRERATQIQDRTYTLTVEIDNITEQITNVSKEIDKLDDDTKEERGVISLKLDSALATNLVLEIKYNVTKAGWFPLYDIKSQNTQKPIAIAYKANVYQQTGTDWTDANIILSTGDPTVNTIKPVLNTKYLNFTYRNYNPSTAVNRYSYKYNPTVQVVSGIVNDQNGQPLPGVNIIETGTSNGTQTDFDGRYNLAITNGNALSFSYIGFTSESLPIYSSVMNINMEPASSSLEEVVVVGYGSSSSSRFKNSPPSYSSRKKERKEYNQVVENKEEGITNTKFRIKKKYTIKSNADVTSIEIDNFELDAQYKHYVAPELNENVFLTAKLGNWEKFNLLAGEANIYFEGSYAGKTNIDPLSTTDSLTISLGIDPNIIVEREQLNNYKSKSFTGSNRISNREYKISLKNNKQNPVSITLKDRIPVSQNKEIKLDNIDTKDAKYDQKTGIMTWNIELLANQKTEKQFSYQVRYPKNKRINL